MTTEVTRRGSIPAAIQTAGLLGQPIAGTSTFGAVLGPLGGSGTATAPAGSFATAAPAFPETALFGSGAAAAGAAGAATLGGALAGSAGVGGAGAASAALIGTGGAGGGTLGTLALSPAAGAALFALPIAAFVLSQMQPDKPSGSVDLQVVNGQVVAVNSGSKGGFDILPVVQPFIDELNRQIAAGEISVEEGQKFKQILGDPSGLGFLSGERLGEDKSGTAQVRTTSAQLSGRPLAEAIAAFLEPFRKVSSTAIVQPKGRGEAALTLGQVFAEREASARGR